jgi:preprotein translocase subunit SecF
MNFNFLKYRKIYYLFSGILVIGSLISLFLFGLKPGIDFKGGSILEVEFEKRPENPVIQEKLKGLELGEIVIQPTNERGVILRMKEIDELKHQEILKNLQDLSQVTELRFETIGPVVGRELTQKTKTVVVLAILAIVFYIALAFRKAAWLIKSWQYGLASLISIFHDILIPLGVFAWLGKFYNVEINIPFIVALLTIIGYDINDIVVVFDRIRENLLKRVGENFEETVNKSLNQVFSRSINTVLTTLFPLFAIFFFGGATLKYFSLALIIGLVSGAYSSITIASPLLVSWSKWKKRA